MKIIIDENYYFLFENDSINLKEAVESLLIRYYWEYDTPELREKINSEIEKLLSPFLRDKKLNYLLELSDEIYSPSQKRIVFEIGSL